MRAGRNDSCPCGSGKKYKKCCLRKDEVPKQGSLPLEVIDKFREHQRREAEREKLYGKTRPIIHCKFEGHDFIAIGSELYYSKKWKTFPDFLMSYIKKVLGSDWGNAEIKKPLHKRHQILQWYDEICHLQKTKIKNEEGLYGSTITGPFGAYMLLAYDLYVLRHHQRLQEKTIERIKNPQLFQGARYELFTTATCVRAGFDVAFENEADISKKHVEFIATHRATSQKIAVEAKSKHRQGVLGFLGDRIDDGLVRLNVGSLINQALEKKQVYPLVVFVDVNLPPKVAERMMRMPPPNKLSEVLDRVKKEKDGKDIFNSVIFTNHPHHYGGREETISGINSVVSIFSMKPAIALQHLQPMIDLHEAAGKHGNIPNEFPEE